MIQFARCANIIFWFSMLLGLAGIIPLNWLFIFGIICFITDFLWDDTLPSWDKTKHYSTLEELNRFNKK